MHDDVVLAPGLRNYCGWEIGKLPTEWTLGVPSSSQQLSNIGDCTTTKILQRFILLVDQADPVCF